MGFSPWGFPLTPPGCRLEVDESYPQGLVAPSLFPGQRSCPSPWVFLLALLCQPPLSALDSCYLEQHKAPSSMDAVAGALGTSERKSGGEASGNAASPLVNAPFWARPGGQDSSGHHVAFWEVSPSARPGGWRGASQSPLISDLWAPGTGPQSSAWGMEVGEAGVRTGAGGPRAPAKPSALTPHGPPFPRECPELVPGSAAPGHTGRRGN